MGFTFQTRSRSISSPKSDSSVPTKFVPWQSIDLAPSCEKSLASKPDARSFENRGYLSSIGSQRSSGHDFGRISVLARNQDFASTTSPGESFASAPQLQSSRDESHLGVSSSGDPTVTIKYSPEAADTSTKIVFIQVVQVSLDGTPVKPGTAAAVFSHLDADTTADFYCVDHLSGEADPYYNGDDVGKDTGTQGKATAPTVDADMTDAPNYADASFPVGKTKFKAEFRTIAFSAAGADKGKFYAYAKWSFNKEKGNPSKINHEGTSTNTALPKSKAAINLWCTNHGFVLPT